MYVCLPGYIDEQFVFSLRIEKEGLQLSNEKEEDEDDGEQGHQCSDGCAAQEIMRDFRRGIEAANSV